MASAISFFQPLPSVSSPATRNPHARAASPSSVHPKLPRFIVKKDRPNLVTDHPQFFHRSHRRHLDIFSCKAEQIEPTGAEICSSTETVRTFLGAINCKNYVKLEELLSEDCHFEDLSFTTPFEGKKQIANFLKELANSMGDNVKLVMEDELKCGQSMVTLTSHMEWRQKRIPFTRSNSFFECETGGKIPRIRKAKIVTEWPIKPGNLSLKLLKTATSLFDKFPEVADGFLENPYVHMAWLLHTYNTFIKPIVWPVFSQLIIYYTKLWTIVLCLASYLYVILIKIFKS